MKSKGRLAAIIGGIVGGSLVAFCCGLIFTLLVIMPARESGGLPPHATLEPSIESSPSLGIASIPTRTPAEPSATPTYAVIILSPEPSRPTTTPMPTVTTTPGEAPTPVPSPTPTVGLPFYYKEGSRVEEENCVRQYLQGWVHDASGAPLNGVTVRWDRWGESFFEISGDLEKTWRRGEWKFTYGYGQAGFDPRVTTDFTLQIVLSEGDPTPLSEPLVIHYAGCGLTGQITNIVFKRQ
ncbi:MAG: hypothetical protein CEE40_08000 [Chloroflexi bacterium B3_Chlor]|nr:MAG: hypothetical protein CEE40_08000 [Chloroflexi bacterium B3_Chlor]